MSCQRCKSQRIISIGGKTSDMFDMSFGDKEYNGYVPSNLFFGRGGDYFRLEICAECGQVQAEFPVSDNQIIKAIEYHEENDEENDEECD